MGASKFVLFRGLFWSHRTISNCIKVKRILTRRKSKNPASRDWLCSLVKLFCCCQSLSVYMSRKLIKTGEKCSLSAGKSRITTQMLPLGLESQSVIFV